ncbi:Galactosyltransferase [Popillia japonica]|uniref:Hexosyltransferase n=1 Tax=Popillia japonica TaxID=7064 RepID=A0AAW1LAH1_POPJA
MNLTKFIFAKCKGCAKIVLVLFFVGFLALIYQISDQTRDRGTQSYYSSFGTVEGWDYNTSRDTSLYIQPENITTVLLPEKFCSSPHTLLIIICSSPGNFAIRNVIRDTWASTSNNSNFSIQHYFLLGQVSNITVQEQIEQEFLERNDVIQEYFVDSYNNLTIKSLMMLKLVKSHCLDTVKYVMKTDDDVYVNIALLTQYLRVNGTKNLLVGYLMRGATPVRDRKSKWNAPYYLYKGHKYPPYLSGTGYVMSIDIVPKLYEASFHTSIFYLEDVYITGMLSQTIKLKPRDHMGFTYRKRDFSPCTYLTAITTHRLNETEIKDLHSLIHKTDFRKCKKKPTPKSLFTGKGIRAKKCNSFFNFC